MHIVERSPSDIDRLRELAAGETHALRRDRYRAVLLAMEGEEAVAIAKALGRSRRSVQDWAYVYRDGGIDAIQPKPRKGRPTKLPREREAEFLTRIKAGPLPRDGVCTLRGKDVVRILEQEFGVSYTLDGAYDLLHRLGYACLKPRPRHEKNDPAVMEAFKEHAPFLSRR
jgi:transposase